MEQIFDWMREHLEETVNDVSPNTDKLVVLARVERLINEAEAKREADCCIWKPYKQYKYIILPPHEEHHGMWREELKREPYCSRCGKPIKISEVE